MTVKELIEALQKLPQDAEVLREAAEYQNDWRPIIGAAYYPTAGWGVKANTVVLK